MFVYDISTNKLYQITSTPGVEESLNKVSVLANGDIRVVWAANDGVGASNNIYSTTFTPAPASVQYDVCLLYDPLVAKRAGSVYPIKVRLCDSNRNNLSSPSVTLHAVSVSRVNGSATGPVDDCGNANPDLDFRYDSSILGYIFNLSLQCLNGTCFSTGTYNLNFTAGADPTLHSVPFAVK